MRLRRSLLPVHRLLMAERAQQRSELSVAADATEALLRMPHRCPDPAQDHRTVAPALDVARVALDAAHQVLDGVRRKRPSIDVLPGPALSV